MAVEKAFAINAEPHEIYDELERDLADAARHHGDTFEILRFERDRSIDLRVTISDIPCNLSYRLVPRHGHTEVVAQLDPYGWRYTFFRIITLGMRDFGFEVAVVQGLLNLKEAVEGVPVRMTGIDEYEIDDEYEFEEEITSDEEPPRW
jgi:hypothetical protein